jgi:hypothetical protein
MTTYHDTGDASNQSLGSKLLKFDNPLTFLVELYGDTNPAKLVQAVFGYHQIRFGALARWRDKSLT